MKQRIKIDEKVFNQPNICLARMKNNKNKERMKRKKKTESENPIPKLVNIRYLDCLFIDTHISVT